MLVSTQSTTMMTHNIVVLKIKLCPSFTICSYFFKYRNSRSTVRVAKNYADITNVSVVNE